MKSSRSVWAVLASLLLLSFPETALRADLNVPSPSLSVPSLTDPTDQGQRHYTVDDLADSLRTFGLDRSDPKHHTIGEIANQ
jgi:hypothetical protein